MKIHLFSLSHKMPAWINQGYADFAQRLPAECNLQLVELSPVKRHKTQSSEQLLIAEYERIQRHLPASSHIVLLDERGELWDTQMVAQQLQYWQNTGKPVSLIIGGADGLAPAWRQQAQQCWSLSRLTFPHGLVRVLVAEQLYRACMVLKGHPYHRD